MARKNLLQTTATQVLQWEERSGSVVNTSKEAGGSQPRSRVRGQSEGSVGGKLLRGCREPCTIALVRLLLKASQGDQMSRVRELSLF